MIEKREALDYHSRGRKGKIEVTPTKSLLTARDMSLAYSPGVAYPCLEIAGQDDLVYEYTAKGNLVAVASNGTAVLGLGNIGPHAGKPVMEGKGALFKRFADIDVFDIELKATTPEQMVEAVAALEPTFGGINLEDIKAPDCFYIEEKLKERMNIPVFHDDQHGTAIIAAAALVNALQVTGKRIEDIRLVYNGAGAAGIACCSLHAALGARKENMILCDSKGVIYKGRKEGMNPYKERYAADTDLRTLEEAMRGADVFVGVSVKGAVTKEMVKSMADRPIIFALANPDPEITYDDAREARPDAIVATGRSDYPNQVNNVLGFPFIFRGALDVRARQINDEMKLAASRAIAALAREDVPDSVLQAYGEDSIRFGPDYLIPKPFDPRIMLWVSPAVAQAAMDTGVARKALPDMEAYREELESRLGKARQTMRGLINKAKKRPQSIVFPEGTEPRILRAAQIALDEGFCLPVLLGDPDEIDQVIRENELHIDLDRIRRIDPVRSERLDEFADFLYRKRQRRGVSRAQARKLVADPNYFGVAMVEFGLANALLSGVANSFTAVIRPALQMGEMRPDVKRVSGLHIIVQKRQIYFFADTTVNISPDAETLADIALRTSEFVRELEIKPVLAMLSYSNFGSVDDARTRKLAQAVELVRLADPHLEIDGEMQVDFAVDAELRKQCFPFAQVKGAANTFIFPCLNSANIAARMMSTLGLGQRIGPVLLGFKKAIHVLQRESPVEEIVNMAAIAAVDAREKEKRSEKCGG